jgi:DNA-binding NarL/FixJ family response regulator
MMHRSNSLLFNLLVTETEMIRLLIMGDQPAVRKGLHMRLAAETDLAVVGEVSDCEAALTMLTTLCPDTVLIDIDMLHMDGMRVVNTLHLVCPQVAVIILSLLDDAQIRTRAMEAGAAAFVSKSMPADALLSTVRQVVHS